MIRSHPTGVATAVIAVAAVAAALLAAIQGADPAADAAAARADAAARSDLARCRALGPDGAVDPLCRATWAAQREQFFRAPAPGQPTASAEGSAP